MGVTPLRTLDPDDPDASDLDALREIVGDARVVCLGEAAHCVTEYVRLKDRLQRHLVTELGFTAVVLESGLAEGLDVGAWVDGGPGDPVALSRDRITNSLGDSEPFRAQLRWMREQDGAVRFHGMDLPGSGVDPGPAVDVCLDRLPPHPGDDGLRALARLGDRYVAPLRWAALSGEERDRLRSGTQALVERAGAAGDDLARLCAEGARLVVTWLTDGPSLGPDHNPRDELMARTVRWLLEREDRIVVNAHNLHVQRCPLFGAPSLGMLLAPELGDDLVVIGTTRAAGTVPELRPSPDDVLVPATVTDEVLTPPPAHTLDARLDALGPLHLTDLRRLPAGALDGVTAMTAQTIVLDVDPLAFDAVVHVREIGPLPGVAEAMQAGIDAALSG